MKVYFIRHGHTNLNEIGYFNGQFDEDINEHGIEDAMKAREKVKELDIDLIFCSPLLRTRHTCEIINCNNVPVIYDDRLKERTLGHLDGKKFDEEGHGIDDYRNYYYRYNMDDVEEMPDFFGRIQSFLDELKNNEEYKDKKILVVTHGGVMRVIHFIFNPIPEDGDLSSYFNSNCEIVEYEL